MNSSWVLGFRNVSFTFFRSLFVHSFDLPLTNGSLPSSCTSTVITWMFEGTWNLECLLGDEEAGDGIWGGEECAALGEGTEVEVGVGAGEDPLGCPWTLLLCFFLTGANISESDLLSSAPDEAPEREFWSVGACDPQWGLASWSLMSDCNSTTNELQSDPVDSTVDKNPLLGGNCVDLLCLATLMTPHQESRHLSFNGMALCYISTFVVSWE